MVYRRMRYATIVLLLPVVSITNPPQDAPRSAVEVRRIVSNESSAATTLSRIGAFAATPEGTVYASQNQEGVIRVFDATGKLLRSIGRKGAGPGEFGGPIGEIGFFGDTIWARDNNGRRINFYSRDGRSIGTLGIPSARNGRCPSSTAFLRSKMFVLLCRYGRADGDSTVFVLVDSNGAERLTLFRLANTSNGSLNVNTGTTSPMLQPFAPLGDDAFAPGSSRAAVAASASFWNGRPGQVRLSIVDAGGAQRNVDLSYTARQLTSRDADTVIANRAQQLAASGAASGYLRAPIEKSLRDGLYRPAHFSELAQFNLGDDGSIWVSPPHDPSLWRVHAGDGRLEFTVRVEKGLRVMQVARDNFWAIRTDADGVPTIVQFRVMPR